MAGFPKLIPAFTVQIHIQPPNAVGPLSAGPNLVHLPFVQEAGFIRSEPDYPVKVNAVFVHGADYVKVDSSGQHARLEVQSVLRDAGGSVIRYNYTGTVDLTGPGGKVLRGEPDAATTDFGDVFAQPKFECGDQGLKALENKTFVASGRFIVQQGKPNVVEYKVSEVAK